MDSAKIYAGGGFPGRDLSRPPKPARSSTTTKNSTPASATGTPQTLPYGLRYACVQLTAGFTSQKLV